MSDMVRQDIQRSFRIPADLDAKLVAKAETLDRSVSWVILRALEAQLLPEQESLARAFVRGATASTPSARAKAGVRPIPKGAS